MPEIKLRAENFRVLQRLEWKPEGTCLLAGPNGAGKSTVLDLLRFVRALFERGHESAFTRVVGDHFRRHGVPDDRPVEIELTAGPVRWTLRFPMTSTGLRGAYGEEVQQDGKVMLRAAMFEDGWYAGTERFERDPTRCCAKTLWDRGEAKWMAPLVDALSGIHIYQSYWLGHVKRSEAITTQDFFLHGNGRNLWAVLATWKASPTRYDQRFEWVMAKGRDAFPELLGSIEFDRGLPYVFSPGANDPADGLPPVRLADGLLTGLLHLTAIAGARPGGIVAIDEMENQLHPHAIRRLLVAIRERAEEHDLTVVLTTHSPVVMNAFRAQPENLYVLQSHQGSQPVSLVELHDEDWLAQFSLGDLYDRLDFGAPKLAVGD